MANNTTAVCSFKVIVADDEVPVIACPNDIEVDTDAGLCSAVVTYTIPEGRDNCPDAMTTQTDNTGLSSGDVFPAGIYTLEYTVTDEANLTSTCQFTITVNDGEAPVLTLNGPASITLCQGDSFSDAGANVTDNCDSPATVFSSVVVNTNIPGVYTLPYDYTDAAGNPATTVNRTVIVNAAPQVTIVADPAGDVCLGTLNVQYTAVVTPASPNSGTYSFAWCAYSNGTGSGTCFGGFMPGGDDDVQTRSWTAGTGPRSIGVTVTLAGCTAATDLHVFEVLPNPTATISGNATICSEQSTVITFNGTPNATVTYTVNGGSPQNILLDGMGQATLNSGPLTENTTYALVSVSIGTDPVCTTVLTAAVTVIVEDAPTLDCAALIDVVESTDPGLVIMHWSGIILYIRPAYPAISLPI
jgi:hypothetical protein